MLNIDPAGTSPESLPSQPESSGEDGWGWRISEDKSQLLLSIAGNPFVLSSLDTSELIRFMALKRTGMLPALALTPYEADIRDVYVADAYHFEESRHTMTAHMWLRVNGLGWVQIQLDADPLKAFATSILSMVQPALPTPQAVN